MRKRDLSYRISTALTACSLVLAPVWPAAAQAPAPSAAPPPGPAPQQPAPPPGAAPATGDPPSRVGRLARLAGTVSFHTGDAAQWQAAALNYPVTAGDAFWTEPGAQAAVEIGATRLAQNSSTELDITTLDDHTLDATDAQGEVFAHVAQDPPGDTDTITTPRGQVTLLGAGHYDVVAGDTDHPTLVTVVDGTARVVGPNLSLDVAAHQTASISGTTDFTGTVGAEQATPFLSQQLQLEAPPRPPAYTPPPQVLQMTGCDVLQTTGAWAPTPDYGEVWYPPVATGWVPYREGQWAWVAPWGWTWIDNAPWGFAPFHYGRWVQVGGRWGWTPQVVSYAGRPVYAPALVSFVGVGTGVVVGAALGASFGWIPLGPREPYFPPYHVGAGYLGRVNEGNVTNITTIQQNRFTSVNTFINRGGATVVPASVVQGSQPVAGAARPVTAAQLAAFRPVADAPVRPSLATAGVTPAVARSLNLPAGPGGGFARPAAPGPAVVAARPGAPALLPPGGLRAEPAVARPAAPGAAPQEVPHPGLPPLERPGAGAPPGVPRPTGLPPAAPRPGVDVRPPGPAPLPPGAPPRAAVPAAARPAPPFARPAEPAAARPVAPPVERAAPPVAPRPAPPPVARPAPPPPIARPAAPVAARPPAPPPPPPRPAPPAAPARPPSPPPRAAPPPPRAAPPPRPGPAPGERRPNER